MEQAQKAQNALAHTDGCPIFWASGWVKVSYGREHVEHLQAPLFSQLITKAKWLLPLLKTY